MRPNMAQGRSIFQFSPSLCLIGTNFNQFMYTFPSSQTNMSTLFNSHDWRGQSNVTGSQVWGGGQSNITGSQVRGGGQSNITSSQDRGGEQSSFFGNSKAVLRRITIKFYGNDECNG
ncbi:hypothetical protein RHGRI_013698 [Rhododendron griersonianum]|nr:hypothetical protein RHGRI_013698 [Rhododendron griersonianum]